MKVRGVVVAVAFLLAVGATMAVFAYVNGVKNDHKAATATMVTVVVAKQDIPAGTRLDSLISSGGFTTIQVPQDAVVPGAVTDLSALQGHQTSATIVAGEQIPAQRLVGTQSLGGGVLGIPKGYEAVTVPLDVPRTAGSLLERGDHVVVYATLGTATGAVTVTLVKDVEVLKLDPATSDVTLALKPGDGSRVIFSQEQGHIWLALLPPGQRGQRTPPVTGVPTIQ